MMEIYVQIRAVQSIQEETRKWNWQFFTRNCFSQFARCCQ